MHTSPPSYGLPELARQLSEAPHRLLFFTGACTVLITMSWWALWLASGYLGWGLVPLPPGGLPPGWAHAMLAQYGMLPLFMCGFLLTVFPRWMDQPPVARRDYLWVGGSLFAGDLLAQAGLLGSHALVLVGFGWMLAGFLAALYTLGRILRRARVRDGWAISCWLALMLGAIGLAAFLAYLLGASWWWAYLAIKLGTFGLLLPVYFTICHRMIPFFSSRVATDYRVVRPRWSLPVVWTLLLAHLALELAHAQAWTWLSDVPLCGVLAWHLLAWQPWKCMKPGLLAALYLAFAWLPFAFMLYAVQGVVYAVTGIYVLGRAPLHALAIGFFGSMLVAMVTRVTQGHSGRPLEMGTTAWFCLGLLQVVAFARIGAEVSSQPKWWLLTAATGWLLAFLPWVVRSLRIYLSPRVDCRPG